MCLPPDRPCLRLHANCGSGVGLRRPCAAKEGGVREAVLCSIWRAGDDGPWGAALLSSWPWVSQAGPLTAGSHCAVKFSFKRPKSSAYQTHHVKERRNLSEWHFSDINLLLIIKFQQYRNTHLVFLLDNSLVWGLQVRATLETGGKLAHFGINMNCVLPPFVTLIHNMSQLYYSSCV